LLRSASGPGTFTSCVRFSLACVKGLAAALGLPAAGVSTLWKRWRLRMRPRCVARALLAPRRSLISTAPVYYDAEGLRFLTKWSRPPASWLASLPLRLREFLTIGFPLGWILPRARRGRANAMAAQISRIAPVRRAAAKLATPRARCQLRSAPPTVAFSITNHRA